MCRCRLLAVGDPKYAYEGRITACRTESDIIFANKFSCHPAHPISNSTTRRTSPQHHPNQ